VTTHALLLSDDLLFASRITATARASGITVRQARSADALIERARHELPRCVIVDLSNPGLEIADFLARLREVGSPMPFVAAYGSHVDTATLGAARSAGCDVVWPRSKFVEELPSALPVWAGGPHVA
jgi:CheY-like chemotaxis protein